MSTAQTNLSFFPGIGDEVIVGGFAALVLVYFLYQIVIFILEAVYGSSTDVRTEELSSGRVRANNHDCSICLGEASYAIETNWCVQELNFRFCLHFNFWHLCILPVKFCKNWCFVVVGPGH